MCVLCGDEPAWRFHFEDGRRFTSSMADHYANAQARAVEQVEGVQITKIERWTAGAWCEHVPIEDVAAKDDE